MTDNAYMRKWLKRLRGLVKRALRAMFQPTTYWITYQEQLEKDSRWYRCQNSADGCVWPGNCRPGDCRRVDSG